MPYATASELDFNEQYRKIMRQIQLTHTHCEDANTQDKSYWLNKHDYWVEKLNTFIAQLKSKGVKIDE